MIDCFLRFSNVPVRQLTAEEVAEVEKKALEIERGPRPEDVDEDDSGKNIFFVHC